MAVNSESRALNQKKSDKREIEERWMYIKEQAVLSSTPAMRRSIDRASGSVYTKTAEDYRSKDGSAVTTTITAKTLITERLGKKLPKGNPIAEKSSVSKPLSKPIVQRTVSLPKPVIKKIGVTSKKSTATKSVQK